MRALIVVLSLVCVVIALWSSTRQHAERLSNTRGKDGIISFYSAPAPLIVARWDRKVLNLTEEEDGEIFDTIKVKRTRRYYLWLFGLQVKLPFERTGNDGLIAKTLRPVTSGQARPKIRHEKK
jgi:hypothetical protein